MIASMINEMLVDAEEHYETIQEAKGAHMSSMGDESDQTDEHQVELSEDARIVEIVTADIQCVGVTREVFSTVQRHGYLLSGLKIGG